MIGLRAALAALFLSLVPASVHAAALALQEEPAPAEQVAALRARIGELDAQAEQLGLGGEDLEINQDQLRVRTAELGEALDELVAAVEAGEADEAQKSAAAEACAWLAERLRGEYGEVQARLRELRAAREEAEDVAVVDDEVDELERHGGAALVAYAENLARLEALGAPADRGWLAQELQRRSEYDGARLQLRKSKVDALAKKLKEADESRKEGLQAELAGAKARLDEAVRVLDGTLALMEAQELDVADLRQLRLAAKGELEIEDVSVGVLLGLLQDWGERLKDTLIDNGPRWVFKAALFVGILFLFALLSRLARRIVRKAVSSSKLNFSNLLREFFIGTTGKAVMLIGLLIALSQLGFELGPILAGLGIAGFVLGFALQETLSNFAAGMMILIYRPFDEADVVSVAGVSGKVHEMSLVSTTILTFDNQNLIVPNSKIWGDVITNVTARSTRRVDMVFGIGYADDIPKAEGILRDVVAQHPKVLKEPEPVVRLSALGDSSVDFVVRPWAATSDYWDVYWDVTRSVKLRFDDEGVSIPFPQRDIHVYHESAAPAHSGSTLVPQQPTASGQPYDTSEVGEAGEPAESSGRGG